MKIEVRPFGQTPAGEQVQQFHLENPHGVTADVITYGAILTSLRTPDRGGKSGEITLGFDSLEEYLRGHPCFGAICGRVANRIANARFTLDGTEYPLAANHGKHHLHGGMRGFDKQIWSAAPFAREDEVGVRLHYRSKDGEEGYPGNLSLEVTYTLTRGSELRIDYEASSDKKTPINVTNHAYFNLADGGATPVLEHRLKLFAARYLPVDSGSIPLGDLAPVKGTPMDFTQEQSLGQRIDEVPGLYDHCYVVDPVAGATEGSLAPVARVVEPQSGRVMEVFSTEPGVQLYTGNFLDGKLKSRGATFAGRHGFCLETQHFPDAINQPQFPSTVLIPGTVFRSTTLHKFSVQ